MPAGKDDRASRRAIANLFLCSPGYCGDSFRCIITRCGKPVSRYAVPCFAVSPPQIPVAQIRRDHTTQPEVSFMKSRFVIAAMTAIFTLAVMFDISAAQAVSQQPTSQTPEANPTRPRSQTQKARSRGRRRRGSRAPAKMMSGIPKGVQACLNHLSEMATDPLPDYEGHPSEIVNNGLLWNDEKSNCSIGTDASLRMKLFELGNAWRRKNVADVKRLLEELKSAAPQG